MILDLDHKNILKGQEPEVSFAAFLLGAAVRANVEEIVFELDKQLYSQAQIESENPFEIGSQGELEAFRSSSPKALNIVFKKKANKKNQAGAPGSVFNPLIRVLLNAAEASSSLNKVVSVELKTCNPASTWQISSEDLSSCVHLIRQPSVQRTS